MIQKIQASEYLKRLDNMTAEERDEYLKRVGEWLQTQAPLLTPKMEEEVARFQNVIQCSAMWNDEECRAFTDGARLLTALVPSHDTWLPDMLYVKAAKRAIRQMVGCLMSDGGGLMSENIGSNLGSNLGSNQGSQTAEVGSLKAEVGSQTSAIEHQTSALSPQPSAISHQSSDIIPRPKHIDQYVHLLPKKTQEHAALVQGLYRELDEAREKMRLLADDPTASPRDREAWAKKATKCDNALRKIFDELDAEWNKLVKDGRVVVDDLGNARVKEEVIVKSEKLATAAEDHQPNPADAHQTSNISPQTSALEHQPSDISLQTSEKRKSLRKFLVDTRRGNGATRKEHVKKWKKSFKEYAKLVGEEAYKDEKLLEAAKHYEIEIKKLK